MICTASLYVHIYIHFCMPPLLFIGTQSLLYTRHLSLPLPFSFSLIHSILISTSFDRPLSSRAEWRGRRIVVQVLAHGELDLDTQLHIELYLGTKEPLYWSFIVYALQRAEMLLDLFICIFPPFPFSPFSLLLYVLIAAFTAEET